MATRNFANLGLHDRMPDDHALMAEIISWFDLVAIQEVNDDLSGLRAIQAHMPGSWRAIFSGKAGNEERLAFLYDGDKVSIMEKVGEIVVPTRDHKHIKLPGVQAEFRGFDRNPYLASFRAGEFEFLLVNVHLFFGKDDHPDCERRSLEDYATSRWGDLRRRDKNAHLRDIIVLVDFNLPRVEPGDLVYQALRRRGLKLPHHSTRIGSTISTERTYDQIVFYPNTNRNRWTGRAVVFDFEWAVCEKPRLTASKGEQGPVLRLDSIPLFGPSAFVAGVLSMRVSVSLWGFGGQKSVNNSRAPSRLAPWPVEFVENRLAGIQVYKIQNTDLSTCGPLKKIRQCIILRRLHGRQDSKEPFQHQQTQGSLGKE